MQTSTLGLVQAHLNKSNVEIDHRSEVWLTGLNPYTLGSIFVATKPADMGGVTYLGKNSDKQPVWYQTYWDAPQAAPAKTKPTRRKSPSAFERRFGATPTGFLREYLADVKHVLGLAPARDRDAKGRFIRGNRYQFESVPLSVNGKLTFHVMQALVFGREARV